jgi:ribosomal protein S18 acetylase RimI-like enzyme
MSPPGQTYHFDENYCEEAFLGDGTSVLLRTLRASDKELLYAGFRQLSGESRYFRFFAPKSDLSEDELRALTELDGVRHFALFALRQPSDGGQAVGVARFVRTDGHDEFAEAAITVADCAQSRGLGTILLHRLAAAARERGVRFFRCDLLATNRRAIRLLASFSGLQLKQDRELVRAMVPVPEADPADGPGALDRSSGSYRVLGQSARGNIQVLFRNLLLKWTSSK